MKKFRPGDTLIEVLFAFAILASIVGFAFTGALQAYKGSVSAQNQTVGYLLAQYQADGLKTYRDSIDWANAGDGNIPSFLDGSTIGPTLPAMKDKITSANTFCMALNITSPDTPPKWQVKDNCNDQIKLLAPSLQDPEVKILLTSDGSANPVSVVATVTVSWRARNSDRRDSVINTIILTNE